MYHRSEHISVIEKILQLFTMTKMFWFSSFIVSASSICGKNRQSVTLVKPWVLDLQTSANVLKSHIMNFYKKKKANLKCKPKPRDKHNHGANVKGFSFILT